MLRRLKSISIEMVRGQRKKIKLVCRTFILIQIIISEIAMADATKATILVNTLKALCDHENINAESVMKDLGIQLTLTKAEDPLGLGMEGPDTYEWSSQSTDDEPIIKTVSFREAQIEEKEEFILMLGIGESTSVDSDIAEMMEDKDYVEYGLMAHGRMEFRKISYKNFSVTFVYLRESGNLTQIVVNGARRNQAEQHKHTQNI